MKAPKDAAKRAAGKATQEAKASEPAPAPRPAMRRKIPAASTIMITDKRHPAAVMINRKRLAAQQIITVTADQIAALDAAGINYRRY